MSHEFEGESFPDREPTISDAITGAEYDGWPLKIMSVEVMLEQGRDGGIVNYVWPHEGRFTKAGNWKFHGGNVMDGTTEIECPSKPLMVDASSARAFKLVYDQINEKNKAKTVDFLGSRGLTVWMFDELIWPNVRFGGSE